MSQDLFAPSSADRARALADALLSIDAVSLRPHDPFTWSSGLAAPIYCDNRQTLAHPSVRERIADGFEEAVREYDGTSLTVAGTATAGIPHAAWLADRIEAPMAYVRDSAKGHGQGRRIEGARPGPGDEVVVVEDLISTGRSALNAAAAVRETGANVSSVLAIFSYGLDAAATAFREAGVPCHVLTTFPVLLDVARRQHSLSADAEALLNDWQADPEAWSHEHGG
ncbi:orotate phosphoribosyltransferase [Salinibacter ruber]|uniref:Orotate phosphoribosyltransferase n=1 Tax=Salinibacter ruber TaxID=146919 RepID=A0A9X2TFD4_9BACT|nr:orotate phosphoribosyltransferase [Salinibacter ruber]MCS3678929.1 orotate phosphoribosyltransferase [Salinibacter ruber]MCS3681979.1 orotate phosphoribosyltransferase [Salinibacter ruber]